MSNSAQKIDTTIKMKSNINLAEISKFSLHISEKMFNRYFIQKLLLLYLISVKVKYSGRGTRLSILEQIKDSTVTKKLTLIFSSIKEKELVESESCRDR